MGAKDTAIDRELMENVDVVAPSATQLNSILGDTEGNMDDKINDFMQKNPGMNLLVKKGSEGASFISNKNTDYMDQEMAKLSPVNETIELPAYKSSDFGGRAKLIDSAGAGDCFTAAFAVGVLEGNDVEASLDFANK